MMQTSNKYDNIHKAWLYRVLEGIASDKYLPSVLYFKGGTCASMLGWLDRFSVDLDFDYGGNRKMFKRHGTPLKQFLPTLVCPLKIKARMASSIF